MSGHAVKLVPRPSGRGSTDPGEGFSPGVYPPAATNGGLLNLSPVRRTFDLMRWLLEADLYSYQQALDGRSGPRVSVGGRRLLMLSSYDYLGLIGHPAITAAAEGAIRKYGTGTGGVRILTGTNDLHTTLEAALAASKGTEAAVTYSSCFLANQAVIASLFGPRDRVLIDSLAHRSIVDACTLARVPIRRFPHNDMAALEAELASEERGRRTLIIVDGVYSMEGDICTLPDLVDLKRRYGAFLMVDEAHALGVLGRRGRGTDEHFGLSARAVDIWTGSLSKAIPAMGGFVAGAGELVAYLQHASAPYIFSAALCPAAAAAALAALRVIDAEPGRIETVRRNTVYLREGLQGLGFDTGSSATPIIPVITGDERVTYVFARELLRRGVMANAVTQPAVPRGQGRLRLCATAAHSKEDLDEALHLIHRVGRLQRVSSIAR